MQAPRELITTYRITFKPSPDIFRTGVNPVLLLRELRELGQCTVTALSDAVPYLAELDPETCYTTWNVMITTDRGIDAIKDVFLFVEDAAELKIEAVDVVPAGKSDDDQPYNKKLGDILLERLARARPVVRGPIFSRTEG